MKKRNHHTLLGKAPLGLLISFFFLGTSVLTAQKLSFGASGSMHFALYQFEEAEQQKLEAFGFDTPATANAALGFYADYQTTERFHFRVTTTAFLQKIRISESGQSDNQLDIGFGVIDLGLTGRFVMPISTNFRLVPYTGISFGYHQHTGTEYKSTGATGTSDEIINQITQGNSFDIQSSFFQPTAILGFTFGKKDKRLDFDIRGVYSPVTYAQGNGEIPISSSGDSFFLKGKFHHISLSVNYALGKNSPSF